MRCTGEDKGVLVTEDEEHRKLPGRGVTGDQGVVGGPVDDVHTWDHGDVLHFTERALRKPCNF